MRILRSGRLFFVAQWIVPPLLLVVLLSGRGWATELAGDHPFARAADRMDPLDVVFIVLAGVVIVAPAAVPWAMLLWLPAILTVADRDVRRSGRTRLAYEVSAGVAWVASVPACLAVPALWDDAGLRDFTVVPLFPGGSSLAPGLEVAGVVGAGIGVAAWTGSVLFAIAGAILSRSERPAVSPVPVHR